MERYRYIDLLLTMRSEFMKTKPAREQILDNIKIYPHTFSKAISLSKFNKYGVGVAFNITVDGYNRLGPYVSIIIAEKDYVNKVPCASKIEYKLKKTYQSKDTIVPTYNIECMTKLDGYTSFIMDHETNGAPVDYLLGLDLFKLKICDWHTFDLDTLLHLRYCFSFEELFFNIEHSSGFFEWTLRYDLFSDQLIFKRRPMLTSSPREVKDFKDELLFESDDIPINYGNLEKVVIPREYREYLSKLLTTSIKSDVIAEDWREYLDRHLIVAEDTSFDIMPKIKKQTFAYKVETN